MLEDGVAENRAFLVEADEDLKLAAKSVFGCLNGLAELGAAFVCHIIDDEGLFLTSHGCCLLLWFGNVDFVLVSKDMKEQVEANASRYGSSAKPIVLIDDEKIEKMANDPAYAKKYEGIIESSLQKLEAARNTLAASGATIKNFGMSVGEDGKTSFFAVLEKASDAANKIREKNIAKHKAEKAEEKKKAEKKKEKERLEEIADDEKEYIEFLKAQKGERL